MLEFTDSAGYTFYLNHLISFLVLMSYLFWSSKMSWTAGKQDKALHAWISGGLTALFIGVFNVVHFSWWVAPILVLVIGLGKEVADYLNPKKKLFDVMDLVADLAGILSISMVYLFSFVLASK